MAVAVGVWKRIFNWQEEKACLKLNGWIERRRGIVGYHTPTQMPPKRIISLLGRFSGDQCFISMEK